MPIVDVWLEWILPSLDYACGGSIVLGALTWWLLRRAERGPRARAIAAVVVLPPIVLVVGYLGFAGYGLWCAFARDVDPGVGEVGRVPLGSRYELSYGSNDEASVMSPAHETLGLAIGRLGFDDHAVYFETERDRFRLIEKANGHISRGLSEAELAAKLRSLGSSEVRLRPPKQVYMSLRWGLLDLLAIPMVLGVPAMLILGVVSYVSKVWRNAQQSGVANHAV